MKTAILELIASRICHDLISPTSAIHNGIEFAEEMGFEEAGAEAFELISQSVKVASSRLQVFRIMYGMGGKDAGVKPEDIHKIFGELLDAEGKTKQDWDPYGNIGLSERPIGYAKIMMAALILGLECLPKGGLLKMEQGPNDSCVITATGVNATIRDQVVESLEHSLSEDELDARTVHAYATSLLASEYGFKVKMQASADSGSADEKAIILTIDLA